MPTEPVMQEFRAGLVRAFAPDVEETRRVEFTLSTATRDSHGTVMNQQAWDLERYAQNPVVSYQHSIHGDPCLAPDPDSVIGISEVWLEDTPKGRALIGAVTFEPEDLNPLAEKLFRKVLHGTLRAASVGMRPKVGPDGKRGYWGSGDEAQGRPNETFYFYGQELAEWSIVNIPSNPDAVRSVVRDSTARALPFLRDAIEMRTGQRLSLGDLRRMSIGEALDAVEGREVTFEQAAEALEEIAVEVSGVDPAALRSAVTAALAQSPATIIRNQLKSL